MHGQQGKWEGRGDGFSLMLGHTVLDRKPGRHISMYGRSERCVQVCSFFQYWHIGAVAEGVSEEGWKEDGACLELCAVRGGNLGAVVVLKWTKSAWKLFGGEVR